MFCKTLIRHFSTHQNTTPSIVQLMAKLRRYREGTSLSAVKEALQASGNDYAMALKYLDARAVSVGQQKQAKLSSRSNSDGCVCLMERKGVGAVLVEVNCETDFVARTAQFQSLVSQVAGTALMLHPVQPPSLLNTFHAVDLSTLSHMPILPDQRSLTPAKDSLIVNESRTVEQAIVECVGRLGESIHLNRAILALPPSVSRSTHDNKTSKLFTHIHGVFPKHGSDDNILSSNIEVKFGKMGAMLVLEVDKSVDSAKETLVDTLGHQLVQHIVGMKSITHDGLLAEPFLYEQSKTVAEILESVNAHVYQFSRFACGEPRQSSEESLVVSAPLAEHLEPEAHLIAKTA